MTGGAEGYTASQPAGNFRLAGGGMKTPGPSRTGMSSPFGDGYYGLQAASCGYFGVAPADLNWPQAALLAGLVQAPSAYDPLVHAALARAREAHVLGRLAATGTLTRAQAERAYRQPLHLTDGRTGRCAATAG